LLLNPKDGVREVPATPTHNLATPKQANLAETEADRWLRDNREAIDEYNDYVERNGLSLAEFRAV
jgi:post-segregation antitoxin (ccd killing protein)